MSTYTKLTWPVQDLEAVCKEQTLVAPGNLSLNGNLQTFPLPPEPITAPVYFVRSNIIRSISLSSANNLNATNFVIQGFQNGAVVTETLAGPTAGGTVYGTKPYDIITSVSASTAVAGIKVGTGKIGFLPLLVINPNAGFINYSMEVDIIPSIPGITYSIKKTLAQVSQNFFTFTEQLPKFFEIDPTLTNQTTSRSGNSIMITNFILFQINDSTLPATDTLDFLFLQE